MFRYLDLRSVLQPLMDEAQLRVLAARCLRLARAETNADIKKRLTALSLEYEKEARVLGARSATQQQQISRKRKSRPNMQRWGLRRITAYLPPRKRPLFL